MVLAGHMAGSAAMDKELMQKDDAAVDVRARALEAERGEQRTKANAEQKLGEAAAELKQLKETMEANQKQWQGEKERLESQLKSSGQKVHKLQPEDKLKDEWAKEADARLVAQDKEIKRLPNEAQVQQLQRKL